MVSNLSVTVKEVGGTSALVVQVAGSIDSSQDLDAVSKIIESSDRKLFLLSMRAVDYINSAGVGEIIAMSHTAKELGKKVCFAGIHPYVREVFELLGGNYFVPIYESEKDALAAAQ